MHLNNSKLCCHAKELFQENKTAIAVSDSSNHNSTAQRSAQTHVQRNSTVKLTTTAFTTITNEIALACNSKNTKTKKY